MFGKDKNYEIEALITVLTQMIKRKKRWEIPLVYHQVSEEWGMLVKMR